MVAWLFLSSAWASGASSAAPPPPPRVDLASLPASATARGPKSNDKPHPVLAHLLLDRDALTPGSTVRAGLLLEQDDGWHTYWKTPGEVGQPTEVAWKLPAGVTAGELKFPVPQRFEQDGIASYGYADQVLLLTDLVVPADAPPGPITLAADVSWLVCLTSCIPGKVHLELPATIGPSGAPSQYAALFDHYQAQLPTGPDGLQVEYVLSASAVRPNDPFRAAFVVTSTAGAFDPLPSTPWPTFTPIVTGYDLGVTAFDAKLQPDGKLFVTLSGDAYAPEPLPTAPQSVGGLLQVQVGGKWVRTELGGAVPWAAEGAPVTPVNHPALPAAAPPPSEGGAGNAPEAAVAEASAVPAPRAAEAGMNGVGLVGNMLLAFVGGLILNIMPCVLPVLTLKLYSLVEQADLTASRRRQTGVAYAGGVVASFWALALAVVVMRVAFGLDVDWGFQFQYPPYVAALATVVFAFGLSLLGVFELPVIGAGTADEASSREGLMGSFFTGVFATLLATPCSAPFLGTAIAYAFAAPVWVLFGIFTLVGLGLAAPFVLVAFVPVLFRYVPRPGAWMDVVKQLLGFTLIATTVWLVGVLMAQIGADRTVWFLAFLVAVSIGAWFYGRFGGAAGGLRQQLVGAGGALLILGVAGAWLLDLELAEEECDDGAVATDLSFHEGIPWQPFTEPRLSALDGKLVFVDFTAEWCFSCKVNERTVLESDSVRDAMQKLGVVPLKADWTRRDEIITKWLNDHGRAGVPMYLVIPADRAQQPILLPEVITPAMVVEALHTASS